MLQKSYQTKTTKCIQQFLTEQRLKNFTASDLRAFLLAHGCNVNKTTVYRNLDKLVAEELIIRHKAPNADGFVYQFAGEEKSCAKHIHFQCEECGEVQHLEDASVAEFFVNLANKQGFAIDFTQSSLNGWCEKCKQKRS